MPARPRRSRRRCRRPEARKNGRGAPMAGGAGGSATSALLSPVEALLPNPLRMFSYARGGGVSRVAKGADCKSAGLCLRRFESYLPHHVEKQQHSLNLPPQLGPFSCCICRKPVPSIINSLHGVSGVSAAARDMNATCQIALCSRPQGWPRNPHRPGPSTSARPRRNPHRCGGR
jgi:hypothetical protein